MCATCYVGTDVLGNFIIYTMLILSVCSTLSVNNKISRNIRFAFSFAVLPKRCRINVMAP